MSAAEDNRGEPEGERLARELLTAYHWSQEGAGEVFEEALARAVETPAVAKEVLRWLCRYHYTDRMDEADARGLLFRDLDPIGFASWREKVVRDLREQREREAEEGEEDE
jgi:hypothetical protein